VEMCRIEHPIASRDFTWLSNPLSPLTSMDWIKQLRGPALHSVSITGGEPLCQYKFVGTLAKECQSSGLRVYLETNGCSARRFEQLADYIDFAAIDIKLSSHLACADAQWHNLIENELSCARIAYEKGIDTIIKIVILDSTKASEVEDACLRLKDIDAFLVLQPASGSMKPNSTSLIRLQEKVSRYIDPENVAVIPQAHKLMGML
jgi:7-carboxy-7-deazaguanine synthase